MRLLHSLSSCPRFTALITAMLFTALTGFATADSFEAMNASIRQFQLQQDLLERFEALPPDRQRASWPKLFTDPRLQGSTRERARVLAMLPEIQPDKQQRVEILLPLLKTDAAALVADALGNIGPPACDAKVPLYRLLPNEDIAVAGSAARALLRIAPQDGDVVTGAEIAFWRMLSRVAPRETYPAYGEFQFLATIVAQQPESFETVMLKQLRTGDDVTQRNILLTWAHLSGEVPVEAVPLALAVVESPTSSYHAKIGGLMFLTMTSAANVAVQIDSRSIHNSNPSFDLVKALQQHPVKFKAEMDTIRLLLEPDADREMAIFLLAGGVTPEVATRELLKLLAQIQREPEPEPWGWGEDVDDKPRPPTPMELKTQIAAALGENGTGREAVTALKTLYRQGLASLDKDEPDWGIGSADRHLRYACIESLTKLAARGELVAEFLGSVLKGPDESNHITAAVGLKRSGMAGAEYVDSIAEMFHATRKFTIENDSRTCFGYNRAPQAMLLSAWWQLGGRDARIECRKQFVVMLTSENFQDRWAILRYFDYDPSCHPLLDDLRAALADDSLRDDEYDWNEEAFIAMAICKIAPDDVEARKILLSATRQEMKVADQYPPADKVMYYGSHSPLAVAETDLVEQLADLPGADIDRLLDDAMRSRNIAMRRAATMVRSSRQ